MIDESLYPCLNLVRILNSEKERITSLLHIAKAVHIDPESLALFFKIKSMPGNPWITSGNIPEDHMEQDYHNYEATHCTDPLQDFPEACRRICTLCKFSSRYTNQRISSEQFIISALLEDKTLYEKKSLLLKPTNFKAGFFFIVEQNFIFLPLYRLMFQYIQSCNTLEVPDNPLLDNINTPGWERIIDAFLYSTPFKRGVKWQAFSGLVQSLLLPAIKESLLMLKPPTDINLHEFEEQVKELLTRKKYVPLPFGTTNARESKNVSAKNNPTLQSGIPPILSAPPVKEDRKAEDYFNNLSIITSDGNTLSSELLQGLCSPVERPTLPTQPERITAIPQSVPLSVTESDGIPKSTDTSACQCMGLEPAQLLDSYGRYEITALIEQHLILTFRPEMLHSYLYDAYISGKITIDCALCRDAEGFLLFVPGHGAPIWIPEDMEPVSYLLRTLLSDSSIHKITWNLPELIALCYGKGFQYPKELSSLTAAYSAAFSSAPLYPLLPIMAYGSLDLSSPASFVRFLESYDIIYSCLGKEACRKNGCKSLRIWEAYERALSTSVYLCPHFAENRNLRRTGLTENEFIFTPRCRKIMGGSCVHISIQVGGMNQQRLLDDQKTKMSILAGLFLNTELSTFDLKLLSYKDNYFTLFLNTREKCTLRLLEMLIGNIIAKKMRESHYPPPTLSISYR